MIVANKNLLKEDETIVPICPERSPLLLGPLRVINDFPELAPSSKEFRLWYGDHLRLGGVFRPPDCIARQRVAVIVPYRWKNDKKFGCNCTEDITAGCTFLSNCCMHLIYLISFCCKIDFEINHGHALSTNVLPICGKIGNNWLLKLEFINLKQNLTYVVGSY